MRILCCLDGTNSEQLSGAAALFVGSDTQMYGLLYVTDTEPRKELARTRERFLRRPTGPIGARDRRMQQAEQTSALDILNEGLLLLPGAETIQREGRPEREIVNCAAEWRADVILILPRTEYGERSVLGPRSVGHVARFVLDHAPCPVFLVRPLAREQFPLQR